jgi:hypothetical protein
MNLPFGILLTLAAGALAGIVKEAIHNRDSNGRPGPVPGKGFRG